MPATQLPQRTRTYQNHHLDGTRWDRFTPRDGDIVVATAYKAGTTWMQTIVSILLFGDSPPGPIGDVCPWIGVRGHPIEPIIEALEAQTHRRSIKSHTALDGLPFYPQAKYVYVGRHGPDVFMSLWNHYSNYTDEAMERFNDTPGRVGEALPRAPDDPRTLWQSWATRGWFPWEGDGWPFWSLLHHVRTWWEWRHLDNVLFVHFNDLLADLEGEMRRVAAFLEIDVPEAEWPARAELATFDAMKERGERVVPGGGAAFEGGADTFLHKGTNGRWKGVLDDADLALWQANVERQLPPACAHWLEHGGPV
ncbi:MAG TPA: sulfotransferase domain-containing protein [Myxococcota bacterium]|nr:sulfotransferase domain-containing protein [Myxococcota bacterium]